MPFLGLVKRRSQSANFIIPYWVIQNQGFGPALNVRFSVRSQEGTENQGTISALAQGEEHNLAGDAGKLVKPGAVLRIEYSSLSGLMYTTHATVDNDEVRTQFQKLKS